MWIALLWIGAYPIAAFVCELEAAVALWWRANHPQEPAPFWRLLSP